MLVLLGKGFMNYANCMDSGAMMYIPRFIKIGYSIQKFSGGSGDIHTAG
jgi:hypothetical protein